jgi:hypothetical protein
LGFLDNELAKFVTFEENPFDLSFFFLCFHCVFWFYNKWDLDDFVFYASKGWKFDSWRMSGKIFIYVTHVCFLLFSLVGWRLFILVKVIWLYNACDFGNAGCLKKELSDLLGS